MIYKIILLSLIALSTLSAMATEYTHIVLQEKYTNCDYSVEVEGKYRYIELIEGIFPNERITKLKIPIPNVKGNMESKGFNLILEGLKLSGLCPNLIH